MTTTTSCPRCGQPAAGTFCSHCGAPLAGATCGACGAPLTAGAAFCHVCGTPAAGGAPRRRVPLPWIVAAVAAVAFIAVVAFAVGRSLSGPPGSAARGGAPPGMGAAGTDLRTMTPREQADRLFDRVMRAHEAGDTAQVNFFAPMAVQAYGLVGPLDADARYHVGLIQAISGNVDAALAQADTMQQAAPEHLMANMLKSGIELARGNQPAARRAYRAFVEHYESELAKNLPEYQAHRTAIEMFHEEAQAALGAGGS